MEAGHKIRKMVGESFEHHPERIRWNKRYSLEGPEAFGRVPSDWLVAHADLLIKEPKGPALDVACGNGRNAFYLAELGFSVDAVDISDEAVTWLAEKVKQHEWSVYPKRMNLESDPLPTSKYQVVVNINYLERSIFSALKDALLPGGLLVFETLTKDQVDILGSQINPHFTLDHNELLKTFSDMRILSYREEIIDAGALVTKKAVASLVARKKTEGY